MDPILIVLLGITGVALAPKVIPTIASHIIVNFGKMKKRRERKKEIQKEYRPTKKQQAEKERERRVVTSKVKVDKYRFRSVSSKRETDLTLKEMSFYDPDKDEILHGKLKITAPDGKVTLEDIYMYQPRVLSANNSLIGPKKTKNGNIASKNCYLCRAEGSDEILRGYIPKREILSNLCYDFDIQSPHRFADRFPDIKNQTDDYRTNASNIEKFIQIEFDKDQEGNFIPVDLKKKSEAEKFRAYIQKHKTSKLQPREYFLDKIKLAEFSLEDYLEKTKPSYARANIRNQEQTILKVEDSKKPETENPYAWYDRFNYYLPSMLGDRVQVGDTIEHGAPHGPHPGHGPRR